MLQQCLPFTVLKRKNMNIKNLKLKLQQCLPFTVLKPNNVNSLSPLILLVATVLTVYGIETSIFLKGIKSPPLKVATVLTVYGIETYLLVQYIQY